jgi:hypothetical protein
MGDTIALDGSTSGLTMQITTSALSFRPVYENLNADAPDARTPPVDTAIEEGWVTIAALECS